MLDVSNDHNDWTTFSTAEPRHLGPQSLIFKHCWWEPVKLHRSVAQNLPSKCYNSDHYSFANAKYKTLQSACDPSPTANNRTQSHEKFWPGSGLLHNISHAPGESLWARSDFRALAAAQRCIRGLAI